MSTTKPRRKKTAASYMIEDAADLIGVCADIAYDEAREHNTVGGVPVVRVGRRIVVPRSLLNQKLGITGKA